MSLATNHSEHTSGSRLRRGFGPLAFAELALSAVEGLRLRVTRKVEYEREVNVREIARVAGLIFQEYPGISQSAKQVHRLKSG